MKLVPLVAVAGIALVMALVQHYALIYYWYWTYWWLDIVMHTLGGVVVGLLVSTYVGRRWGTVVLGVLIVGLSWEVYEYVLGLSLSEPNFLMDSALDLLMDTIGGFIAYGMMGQWELLLSRLTGERGASQGLTSSLQSNTKGEPRGS